MARPPAVQLAPGVWRVPTAPRDLINTFVLVDVQLLAAASRRQPSTAGR